ncbi:hypothetical protein C2W62_33905 [Candidatus Entotheonella serta]|nr:hypothetical protein C2W62_33905 [Candidatus Entotheonella serta]
MSGLFRLSMHMMALMLAILPGVGFGQIDTTISPSDIGITLTDEATGFTAPIWGTAAPGVDGRLYVADQIGIAWAIDIATAGPGGNSMFLDLRSRLVADLSLCNERGLLALAFHSQYTTPGTIGFGRFYTYSSEHLSVAADFSTIPAGQTADHQSVITEWRVDNPTNPDAIANPNSARVLLRIDQPQYDKNGGAMSFDLNDRLYIALGDGGGVDDQGSGHSDSGNGQDNGNVLGMILRIDPTGSDAANGRYGIPVNNPYIDEMTIPNELYAYGFQNPSRMAFDSDPLNELLYVGEVDQRFQEVNIVVAGGNYGWNVKEGPFFNPGADTSREGLIDPISQYDLDEGSEIIGGVIYRGLSSALRGRYIFGDRRRTADATSPCSSANGGRLFVMQEAFDFGTALTESLVEDNSSLVRSEIDELGPGQLSGRCLLGFGQDNDGEVYVLANGTGTPSADAIGTGVVMRIRTP